jgi:hypothetical protein
MTLSVDKQKQEAVALEQGIVPLPLQQAENTTWTVRRPGPSRGRTDTMATLYRDADMDIGDFAWIILNWSDPVKKRAAYTLLTDKLKQPQITQSVLRHGPEVLSGGTYLEEQQYESMYFGLFSAFWGVVFGVLLIGSIVWGAAGLILQGHPWPATVSAAVIVIAILVTPIALYARYDFKKETRKSRDFRIGREGEAWVAERVSAKLDSRWTVFRNLKLPTHEGDCDFVLVGPPGIYVLEVKAYGGTLRVNNGVWEAQSGRKWRTLSQNPQAQATRGAVDIKNWLNRHNVIIPYVDKAVVLTKPQPSTAFATAKVPVWLHYDVDSQLAHLNDATAKLDTELIEQTIAVLREAALGKTDKWTSR